MFFVFMCVNHRFRGVFLSFSIYLCFFGPNIISKDRLQLLFKRKSINLNLTNFLRRCGATVKRTQFLLRKYFYNNFMRTCYGHSVRSVLKSFFNLAYLFKRFISFFLSIFQNSNFFSILVCSLYNVSTTQ